MAAISQNELTTTLQRYNGTSLADRAVFNVTDFKNLSFANLQVTGAKFPANCDFTGCSFDGAHLRGTFFVGTSISAPNKFDNTSWEGVNAYSSKYEGVAQVFSECTFYSAKFVNSKMNNSIFVSCIFDNVTIKNCDFSNSTFIDCQFSNNTGENIVNSNFTNCLFRSSNALASGITTFEIPNTRFINCNFEAASFFEVSTTGAPNDIGLVFNSCNLKKSTFVFRPQKTPFTVDKYRFFNCALGNAVIPWENPRPTVTLSVNIDFYDDAEHAVQFDRNTVP